MKISFAKLSFFTALLLTQLAVQSYFFSSHANAAKSLIESEANVYDPKKIYLNQAKDLGLIIDHPSSMGYEVYGSRDQILKLKALGAKVLAMPKLQKSVVNSYPSPEAILSKMQSLQEQYSNISKIDYIGKSVKNRDLYFIKISDNPNMDELEPEVKFIANMHGDEITGREMMTRLVEDLLSQYGKDPQITDLINNNEIYIMPSMNPDGAVAGTRANANRIDLNRDFPDFSSSDNQNTISGRAIETQHVMRYQASRNFVLSTNFHGGAEVVNYPWDTIADDHPILPQVIQLSKNYANTASYIGASREFPGGIVNGYAWYEVDGGMQDWSYYWHNDLQFTIELSQSKWPNYSRIDQFYKMNRQALVNFLDSAKFGQGIYFSDANVWGEVQVYELGSSLSMERFIGSFEFKNSEFYKILPDSKYRFKIKANVNGQEQLFNLEIEVNSNSALSSQPYILVQ